MNTLHHAIHAAMDGIPVPDGKVAKQAAYRLNELEELGALDPNDSLEDRLNLLCSLFPDSPTGTAFTEQLSLVKHLSP